MADAGAMVSSRWIFVALSALLVLLVSLCMLDHPMRNNMQLKTHGCDGTGGGAKINMAGVRLTTQGNIAIGYDDDGKSKCSKTSLDQCRYRTVYEYPDDTDKIKVFAEGVLFDDLYRNYIAPNIETYASGNSSNASETSPNHPCFGASAAAELSSLYGPFSGGGNAASSSTTAATTAPATTAAVYQFGACNMTCDDLTGRLYTYLEDQLPHTDDANFLRIIKYVYASLILIFLFAVVYFSVIKSERLFSSGPVTVTRSKAVLLLSILAIVAFLIAQMLVLEKFRKNMDSSGAKYGISYQITGVVIGFIAAGFSGYMVSHEDMASLFKGGYMNTLL